MVSVPPPLFLPKLAMIAADPYVQEFLFAVDRRNIDMRQNKFGMAMSPYPA